MNLGKTIAALVAMTCAFLPWQAAAQEPPEAVYRNFHDAMLARDFSEMSKWGSAKVREDLEDIQKDAGQLALFNFMVGMTPRAYKVTDKIISADGAKATLYLNARIADEGKVSNHTGKIELVKEGGAWKVLEEEWGGVEPSPAAAKAAAADTSPPQPVRRSPLPMADPPAPGK